MQKKTTAPVGTLDGALQALERRMIEDALARRGGHQAQAAADLGITERVMGLRMRKYRIDRHAFRNGAPEPSLAAAGAAPSP
jgi:Nif-specific regulatory protein